MFVNMRKKLKRENDRATVKEIEARFGLTEGLPLKIKGMIFKLNIVERKYKK